MRYDIKVIPLANINAVVERDGVLRVSTTAPATDGKANKMVIKLLAEHFDVPKSAIRIVRGHTGRNKLIEVIG